VTCRGWAMPITIRAGYKFGEAPPDPAVATKAQLEWDRAKKMLQESDWSMLPDVPMTSGAKAAWD